MVERTEPCLPVDVPIAEEVGPSVACATVAVRVDHVLDRVGVAATPPYNVAIDLRLLGRTVVVDVCTLRIGAILVGRRRPGSCEWHRETKKQSEDTPHHRPTFPSTTRFVQVSGDW